VRFPLPG